MRALGDRKAFGRTLEDRIKLIRAEIDAMSDREQMATLVELPVFFRRAPRQSLLKADKPPRRRTGQCCVISETEAQLQTTLARDLLDLLRDNS